MQRALFRRCVVALQRPMGPADAMPGRPGGFGGFGGPSPEDIERSGGTMDMQHALHVEAERRRKLSQVVGERYTVVKEERGNTHGRVIGIDLGTTNSCISYIDMETMHPKIIPSPTGSWVYPTAVTFDKNHEVRLFGEEARACVRTSAAATLCSGKRLIGRGFGELGKVQAEMTKTNILSVGENGEVAVEVGGRKYAVVHIIAMFLRYLKVEAEKYLKEPVNIAVVSVPAYFTPQQKVATEDAALAAGFDVLEVIDEPSAACLTYTALSENKRKMALNSVASAGANAAKNDSPSEHHSSKRIERSLVFDLGGGTLDCAVMEYDRYRQKFTLVATHGDPVLGGNDWDTIILHHFAQQFESKWHIPIEDEDGNVGQAVTSYRNLTLEAEKAKVHFTHSTEPYYGYNRGFHFSAALRDLVPLEATLTYEEYINLTRPLRARCLECVTKLFEHTNIRPEDIDNVLLVGAMTRDPPVRRMLKEFFDRDPAPEEICPADYAVAIGAAVRGGMLQGIYPELSSSTRFVSGTVQSLRGGGMFHRLLGRLRYSMSSINPNAIGTRWRGRAKGLSDDEIAQYAKELVQFEAACARRLLLERAEEEANFVMRRVSADSNRKQGMQERRIVQLSEQLKFWQYMVHNFHDHEDEMLQTVNELRKALDELDGLTEDSQKYLTEEGTIDFTKAVNKTMNHAHGRPESEGESQIVSEAERLKSELESADAYRQRIGGSSVAQPSTAAADGSDSQPGAKFADVSAQLRTAAKTGEQCQTTSGALPQVAHKQPKILRRTVPLPKGSADAEEIVESGHPALYNRDVYISENTRSAFLENQVEDRAWREPPKPPGEEGSWLDVKEAMDRGEVIGAPVPMDELVRSMTMAEMEAKLKEICPIDDPPTPEHARRRDEAIDLHTMVISSGAVDMNDVDARIVQDQALREHEVREAKQKQRKKSEQISASMHR